MPPSEAGRASILSRCGGHATNGCLVVTLPADLDTELVEKLPLLLDDIGHHGHKGLIINLSRVDILPSKVATVIVELASAARLLDSPAVICGIKPSLASAMSTLGIALEGVLMARDLDGALVLLAGVRLLNKSGQPGFRNRPGNGRSPA
jgi:rsbT antagonist protein RsbS